MRYAISQTSKKFQKFSVYVKNSWYITDIKNTPSIVASYTIQDIKKIIQDIKNSKKIIKNFPWDGIHCTRHQKTVKKLSKIVKRWDTLSFWTSIVVQINCQEMRCTVVLNDNSQKIIKKLPWDGIHCTRHKKIVKKLSKIVERWDARSFWTSIVVQKNCQEVRCTVVLNDNRCARLGLFRGACPVLIDLAILAKLPWSVKNHPEKNIHS